MEKETPVTWQQVRIGIGILYMIFLIVLLASVIYQRGYDEWKLDEKAQHLVSSMTSFISSNDLSLKKPDWMDGATSYYVLPVAPEGTCRVGEICTAPAVATSTWEYTFGANN